MAVRFTRDELASPASLLAALQALFPDFGDEELAADIQSGEANLHTIMMEFASFFRAAAAKPAQLSGLASLMGQCVAATDELENAVGTCFLEHVRQTDRPGIFWKCLSPDVKTYIQTH
jgi:hypothetical protein